ncbi:MULTISPECIES: hypothetical protein [Streptomyces]|uniref:hypothetical protein n=1 Tax=Streptomyces TaxID=1883 RepID=UPI0029B22CAB|nr:MULTISPECIES: hypothetical protein [unclassified Streptomyces]MDX3185406.1 hypothetical protein [Streptomyces sp. ME02-7008A-1]MDX3305769.1 hypothetical protein [Streptomyces sp. ME02-7008A]
MTTTDHDPRIRTTPPSLAGETTQNPAPHKVAGRDSRQTTPIVRSLALLDKDPRYDRRTGHAALPIEVCFLDGSKTTTTLEMDPGRVLLLSAQLERAVALRAKAQEAAAT